MEKRLGAARETTETPATNDDWQHRLDLIIASMREMSQQTDPQQMVRAYGARMRQIRPTDRTVALSRRGLTAPQYRITRASVWKEEVNPWKEPERLPTLAGGLMGELLYGDQPRVIDDLRIDPDDPGAAFLADQRSLLAVPLYDQGVSLNMVLLMRREPAAFAREQLPEIVWVSNLFGRATHNLVLSEELKRAYEAVDREMKVVAEIQRSLLPARLPTIPTMELAAHYQTSQRAGGDYYDFFALPGGQWGVLIADVSGHGVPAAVLMAITHAIAHCYPGPCQPPGELLTHVNRQLAAHYTAESGTFVTAFFGIYDPARRELTYANAGHNPPRLKRCSDGSMASLDGTGGLPMGIFPDETYRNHTYSLVSGDQLIFYTDGITEAPNAAGEMFGLERLDRVLTNCSLQASSLLDAVLTAVHDFTEGRPATDDRTCLVARIL
jgi:sigma-B regulation protein RsbU (phosphoserine phosphatase)